MKITNKKITDWKHQKATKVPGLDSKDPIYRGSPRLNSE